MIDWQDKVERGSWVCGKTGNTIQPGDWYYSALGYNGEQFIRRDIEEDSWEDTDADNCVSWWRHKRPNANQDKGPQVVNHQVLLHIFHDLKNVTKRQQQCFAWMVGLLLMRAKKLRYLDMVKEDGATFFLLEEKSKKVVHKLRDPEMSEEEELKVKDNLVDVFNMNVADVEDSAAEG